MIAPSAAVKSDLSGTLDGADRKIRSWGLVPEFLESCRSRHGYLSGTDNLRLADLHKAFSDSRYKGIICLRGGYGTPRLLDRIDYELIRANPKVFLGYSDITALHIALHQKCGLVTYHGPMGISPADAYADRAAEEILFSPNPLGRRVNPPGIEPVSLVPGSAEGPLTGGNLSLLAATLGSPYEVETKDRIFFIEDIDEEPYRIDRMLTALRLAGKFRRCRGVLLGTWTRCEPNNPDYSLTLEEIFREIIAPEGKPVLMNVSFGHVNNQMALPYGVQCRMNSTLRTLEIIENHNRE